MKVFLIFWFIGCALSQYDPCKTKDGRSGVCIRFRNCDQVQVDYKNGIFPTLCSNGWSCCPNQQVNQPPSQPLNIRLPTQATTTRSYNRPQNTGKRISEQKCEEYSKSTIKINYAQSLLLDAPTSGQTYKTYTCKFQATGLIVGGIAANSGEFPHMAVLGTYNNPKYDFFCGGSLISNNFVVTAAHCQVRNPNIVRLGDLILNNNADGVNEKTYRIEKFIRHENYNSHTKKNDIGVVKLAQYVTFNDYIRPACLWTKFNIPKPNAIVIGHGSTEYGNYGSDQLLKAQVKIHSNNECNEEFKSEGLNYLLDSNQICAGGNGNDTCPGDSGGPIQIQHGENICIYYVIGVTSFGSSICGHTSGIYTRVSQYLDWIERKVWE